MSGGSQPTPPSPTESAQANAQSQLAGQQFQAENAPILAYEDAITRGTFQPYETALVNAETARSSANQAAANRAIQYQTDPQAYQAREMALQGANNRMGALYGVNPSDYSFSAPGAFQLPSASGLDLSQIGNLSRAIASQLGSVHIGTGGINQLMPASNPQNIQIQ